MTPLPLLWLIAATQAQTQEVCPKNPTVKALKQEAQGLGAALAEGPAGAEGAAQAATRLEVQLACMEELPAEQAAHAFLLLGAWRLAAGQDSAAEPYAAAAGVLGLEKVAIAGLPPAAAERLEKARHPPKRPHGVVWSAERFMPGDIHLVGAEGAAPWIMPVGTFTFQWGERSIPVNVNEGQLTLVTPRTFDEFEALVDGVSEADLIEPAFFPEVRYETRRAERRARREAGRGSEAEPPGAEPAGEPAPGHAEAPPPPTVEVPPEEPAPAPIDPEIFFDELADLSEGAVPVPREAEAPGPGPRRLRPHLGIGGSWAFGTAASAGSEMAAERIGGPGLRGEVGFALAVGRHLVLRPELGFFSAFSAVDLDPARFEGEGWGASIPVEAQGDRILAGTARLPVLLRLGPLQAGLAPAWAVGGARLTGLTDCGDGESCVASVRGRLMAAGGALLLGLDPERVPLQPWLDVGVLHDGERAFASAALILAWEGPR